MQGWQLLDSDVIEGGAELTFYRRNEEFTLRADGLELMTSSTADSERRLVHEALTHCEIAPVQSVLIGGLGLGFTLAEACHALPASCRIHVVEISPKVVAWNKTHLKDITGRHLDDPRVTIEIADFNAFLSRTTRQFDLILCDIDNGPHPFVHPDNDRLYRDEGLRNVKEKIVLGGCIVFWSGIDEPTFARRLSEAFERTATHAFALPHTPKIDQYIFAAYTSA